MAAATAGTTKLKVTITMLSVLLAAPASGIRSRAVPVLFRRIHVAGRRDLVGGRVPCLGHCNSDTGDLRLVLMGLQVVLLGESSVGKSSLVRPPTTRTRFCWVSDGSFTAAAVHHMARDCSPYATVYYKSAFRTRLTFERSSL